MNTLKRILRFQTPLYVSLLTGTFLLFLAGGIIFTHFSKIPVTSDSVLVTPPPQNVVLLRSHLYKFIQPIILSDYALEAYSLAPIKQKVQTALDSYKKLGMINSASVVLKELETGNWFAINSYENYNPGSLVKVAVMITYLKDAESEPGLLDKTIFFNPDLKGIPHQTYEVNPLERGKSYTVRELLKRMAMDSDNNSTALLNSFLNIDHFKKVYADLDLIIPDVYDVNYETNAVDYSKFMTVLFNGSYLNRENSEMALEWLSKSSFNEGLTKYLPSDITVAHKFGEFGLKPEKQWHESAIIYCAGRPYLITIMTKGYEIEKLRQVISDVSKQVYDSMKPNS